MFVSLLSVRFTKLEQRSKEEICNRYMTDVSSTKYSPWSASPYPNQYYSCNLKPYDKVTDDSIGLKEFNYMRWLVGIDSESFIRYYPDDEAENLTRHCAVYTVENLHSSKRPNYGDACYSADAGSGCMAAMRTILYGSGNYDYSNAIQSFIRSNDGSDPNAVENRRWALSYLVLGPNFAAARQERHTAFAMRIIYISRGSDPHLPFTTYPPPGYFPARFIYTKWSFWAPGIPDNADLSITVKIDNELQSINGYTNLRTNLYLIHAGVCFKVGNYTENQYQTLVGKRIDVTITYQEKIFEYTIYPIDCNSELNIATMSLIPPPTQTPARTPSMSPSPSRSPTPSPLPTPAVSPVRTPIPTPEISPEETPIETPSPSPSQSTTKTISPTMSDYPTYDRQETDNLQSGNSKRRAVKIGVGVSVGIILLIGVIVGAIFISKTILKRRSDPERSETQLMVLV
ncbi:hypothetical protein TVAG_233020 [Trichomonas vaginalis G3]|uniref:Uncharacterized protein n=1 Tax=Trichomonas vaginalis (strain ATCC PRA-98 / G3) TaxID=412133 RepID=A2ERX1_TRIV3|nr:hypothetical protein TVAGG3_0486470 [Trichomonas vaginalis G3]EAY04566.1 hypothetical protein TVAG_233020 [Trichomonas vaginalis G3]KAI5516065.1 hypothetical protein TVAGG3_0486470 [Trichomonas vaginalis G3]|eukprot:XP_001316789.1 hypothetical protein [Trichomonas vaginalis G3]